MRCRTPTRGEHGVGDLGGVVQRTGGDCDRGAGCGQRIDEATTDAAAGTRNECDAAVEAEGWEVGALDGVTLPRWRSFAQVMSYANDMAAHRSTDTTVETDVDLTGAVRLACMRLARRLRVERGSDDMTLSQMAVLGTLDRHGASTVGELAHIERVKPPSMTRIVNSLVEGGMVDRRPHETDGRQVVVDLTDDARAVLAEDRRRRDAWLARRLIELTDDERALLAEAAPLLDRLASS